METLREALWLRSRDFGSLKKMALACDVNTAYVYNLYSGKKSKPSNEILTKLGLKKVIIYEKLPQTL